MSNLLDYLKWRGDIVMDYDGFRIIDNILFSTMCYANLSGIVPDENSDCCITLGEAAEKYKKLKRKERDKSTHKKGEIALRAMASTRRFRNVLLSSYVDVIDDDTRTQFAAVKIHLPDDSYYIAFRGTDDNIVGWREDFEMCFREIGAQNMACSYLNRQIKNGKYRIGGHSKGGNLAVYASMNCENELKKHILNIYSNDGPGICDEMMAKEKYKIIEDRIIRIMPGFSMVGVLFANAEPDYIVAASGKGMRQHNPLNWQLEGVKLKTIDAMDEQCKEFADTFNSWVKALPVNQREEIVSGFFDAIESSGKKQIIDFSSIKPDTFEHFFRVIKGASKESRQAVGMLLKNVTNDKMKRITGR
mgnify:CR=1 FL=1